jgi:hypothetical protein
MLSEPIMMERRLKRASGIPKTIRYRLYVCALALWEKQMPKSRIRVQDKPKPPRAALRPSATTRLL